MCLGQILRGCHGTIGPPFVPVTVPCLRYPLKDNTLTVPVWAVWYTWVNR